jgi:prephenate dehydrogenase
MKNVAIVGVGLIGASFGLALRKAGYTGEIVGVSSERSIGEALARGAIDRGESLESAASAADLIFLSQPIFGIIETLGKLNDFVRPDALITDAGSTKQAIVDAAQRSITRCAFVGGHPMAGKELRGAGAAEADLFRGRPWILTEAVEHPLRDWIAAFGAREIILDAARHDRLVAWSSHLPQLASTGLASVLAEQAPDAAAVAGPGLMDTTRLALSSFDLWGDILKTNSREIAIALDAYIRKLTELRDHAETEFTVASDFARRLRTPPGN